MTTTQVRNDHRVNRPQVQTQILPRSTQPCNRRLLYVYYTIARLISRLRAWCAAWSKNLGQKRVWGQMTFRSSCASKICGQYSLGSIFVLALRHTQPSLNIVKLQLMSIELHAFYEISLPLR